MTNETTIDTILRTKLQRPAVPGDHVHRPRLLEYLDQRRERPLALVSAPAGYGKSVLISCWLEASDRPSAWLSLDEQDNDLRQFLAYFLAAVQTIFPDAVSVTIPLVKTSNLPPVSVVARSLANELDSIAQDFILVLDDIHRIRKKSVYDFLNELLRHPPRSMHLVLIGRRDPNLPITSLRASKQLSETRLSDLRFTTEETAAYLQAMLGVKIKEDTAATLAEKTEGWIVGLRLSVLAMRGQDDAIGKLLELKGNTVHMSEYLITEVLDAQLPAVRHNLLSTSILDRFSAPLCDSLSVQDSEHIEGEIDGADFIAKLQNENLFLIALDTENRWFRYHHLFQNLLQNQLKWNLSSEEIASLHSRASNWFEAEGLIEEGLKHALAAEDVERAVLLVERNRKRALNTDRWYVLEQWLAVLPETVVQQRAELLLARAWVLVHHIRFEAAFPVIDQIESLLGDDIEQQPLRGEVALLRGYILFFLGAGAESLKHMKTALKHVPVSFIEARAQTEVIFALSSQMVGRKAEAIRSLDDLLRDYHVPHDVRKTRLVVTYVFIHMVSGDLAKAEAANRHLGEVSTAGGYAYAEAWCEHLQGLIHLDRYELDAAVKHLGRSTSQRFIHFKRAAVDSITGLMLAYQALGREDEARTTLELIREYVSLADDPMLSMLMGASEARLAIAQGRLEPVLRWIESTPSPAEGAMIWWLEIPSVTRCRGLIAEGSPASLKEAQERLCDYMALNEAHHNTYQLIKILPLLAMACEKQGKAVEALAILERAVTLARPGGFIFPFVEFGTPMADLLKRLFEQNVALDYIEKLLAAFPDTEAIPPLPDLRSTNNERGFESETVAQIQNSLVEPLTNRELDVLELLAQRFRNKEIADKLFVSPETVKAHLKKIYQKLNVRNRRQAVEKATILGIQTQR